MPAEDRLSRLRLLLLQIRDEAEVERQEQDCFIHFSGLAPEQFTFRNLVARPDLTAGDLRGFDAVVIGGAGAHSVTEEYPFSAPLVRPFSSFFGESAGTNRRERIIFSGHSGASAQQANPESS